MKKVFIAYFSILLMSISIFAIDFGEGKGCSKPKNSSQVAQKAHEELIEIENSIDRIKDGLPQNLREFVSDFAKWPASEQEKLHLPNDLSNFSEKTFESWKNKEELPIYLRDLEFSIKEGLDQQIELKYGSNINDWITSQLDSADSCRRIVAYLGYLKNKNERENVNKDIQKTE